MPDMPPPQTPQAAAASMDEGHPLPVPRSASPLPSPAASRAHRGGSGKRSPAAADGAARDARKASREAANPAKAAKPSLVKALAAAASARSALPQEADEKARPQCPILGPILAVCCKSVF